MPARGEELVQQRLQKLERLRARGIDPYPPRYHRTHTNLEAISLFKAREKQEGADSRTEEVSLAGRIMTMRGMGKAAFADIKDGSGRIQVHMRRDLLEDQYEILKDLDLGDFIGVKGPIFRTRTGEVTVEAHELTLLTKATRPLPEKWHGLADMEKRYRQRYLDLISNDEARLIFSIRSQILESMRRFFNGRGFMEVETPVLVPVAAGAMANPFETHHNALDRRLFLRIATELYLKRLIVGGLDKVYEIGRVFRNEGIDLEHNPEFTLLESYEAYADYNDVMKMVEEMVYAISQEVLGSSGVEFQGKHIDFTPPWRRINLREEIHQRSGIDFFECPDIETLRAKMQALGLEVEQRASWGRLLDKVVSATVEPNLTQPTFLIDYPIEMSPLAKKKLENPRLVERFEGFAAGMEIANSFTELNDPIDQRQRFEEQEALREQYQGEEMDRLDEDFLVAIEHGMPPTGGLGMGIDRLVMLLTGQRSIREVVFFPQLRTR